MNRLKLSQTIDQYQILCFTLDDEWVGRNLSHRNIRSYGVNLRNRIARDPSLWGRVQNRPASELLLTDVTHPCASGLH